MARSIKRRDDPLLKMGGILSKVYAEYMTGEENINSSALVNNVSDRLVHSDGSVSVDVVAFGTGTELQELVDELSLIGFQVSSTFHHIASGKIPVSALGDMCNCDKLVLARPVIVRRRAGSVLSEGVQAMEADTVLNNLGFDGTGVLVGVISDSYNALGDEDIDIASGDLPSKVRITVLQDYHLHDAFDEGRAMMQLIHDVAPGADLAFHTASNGMADFALGIIKLAGLGCQVIVDDIFIFGEPAFQDGIIAQAVNAVNEVGVAYFSAVGNDARQSYEYPFVDSGQTLTRDGIVYSLHDFGYGSDPFAPQTHQTLYLPNFSDVYIDFQWDEPFVSVPGSPGSRSDLDIFLFDTPGEVILKESVDSNIGRDPIEMFPLNVTSILISLGRGSDQGYLFTVKVGLLEGPPPTRMKITSFGGGGSFIDFPTNSGSSYGHTTAAGSAAVAAANAKVTPPFGVNPALVEAYSSAAGVPIVLDEDGNRLPEPVIRLQPRVTGPDGTRTSVSGFETFSGTSAAAPHVAGVAALVLEANPHLSPEELFVILEETASDMNDKTIPGREVGFDFRTGHGFVVASASVEAALNHKGRMKMNTGRKHKHKQKHDNYKLKAIWIDRKNKQKQKGFNGMNNMSRSRTRGRSNRSTRGSNSEGKSMKSERGSKTKGSKNRRKLGHLRSHLDGNLS